MKKSLYSRRQEDLIALLRDIREEAGLRQMEIAERLGKPQSFVSKYESGQRRLDLVELEEVCKVSGTSLLEFVQRFSKT